jgi:uncharacterized protein YjiS (DUF1127 family)
MIFKQILSMITRELDNRRSMRLLSQLSDHDLGRMGLARGQIEDAVRDRSPSR